jgi:hypothetical protein
VKASQTPSTAFFIWVESFGDIAPSREERCTDHWESIEWRKRNAISSRIGNLLRKGETCTPQIESCSRLLLYRF